MVLWNPFPSPLEKKKEKEKTQEKEKPQKQLRSCLDEMLANEIQSVHEGQGRWASSSQVIGRQHGDS